MPRVDISAAYDEDFDGSDYRLHKLHTRLAPPQRKPKRSEAEVYASLADQAELEKFNFTYDASRHEREWILSSLTSFYDMRWIADVTRLIRGGKEASVYQCTGGEATGQEFIAAKIYRPRKFRNLRNDHLYREGRSNLDSSGQVIQDDRMLRAIHKKTGFGKELMHTSWIEHEVKTLEVLRAAGADVPEPYASGDNAILMTYIGGEETAAPTLNTVDLDPREARVLFQRVLHNIELMLDHDRIHGDLSAYNILYWQGEITLIDFPQAISPHINRNALAIFERDVRRICEYFARQGVRSDPHQLAHQLWRADHLRVTPEVDPLLLDDQDEADRSYWEKYGKTA